jgi:hypothetical protein
MGEDGEIGQLGHTILLPGRKRPASEEAAMLPEENRRAHTEPQSHREKSRRTSVLCSPLCGSVALCDAVVVLFCASA